MGEQGEFVRQRQEAIKRYIAEAQRDLDNLPSTENNNKEGVNGVAIPPSLESKTLNFLKEKQEANLVLWNLYNGQAGKDNEEKFFEASKKAWSESLPDVLSKLDEGMKGPYALGDQVVSRTVHSLPFNLFTHCDPPPTPPTVARRSAHHLVAMPCRCHRRW
jgi:hypothetical protein